LRVAPLFAHWGDVEEEKEEEEEEEEEEEDIGARGAVALFGARDLVVATAVDTVLPCVLTAARFELRQANILLEMACSGRWGDLLHELDRTSAINLADPGALRPWSGLVASLQLCRHNKDFSGQLRLSEEGPGFRLVDMWSLFTTLHTLLPDEEEERKDELETLDDCFAVLAPLVGVSRACLLVEHALELKPLELMRRLWAEVTPLGDTIVDPRACAALARCGRTADDLAVALPPQAVDGSSVVVLDATAASTSVATSLHCAKHWLRSLHFPRLQEVWTPATANLSTDLEHADSLRQAHAFDESLNVELTVFIDDVCFPLRLKTRLLGLLNERTDDRVGLVHQDYLPYGLTYRYPLQRFNKGPLQWTPVELPGTPREDVRLDSCLFLRRDKSVMKRKHRKLCCR